MLLSSNLACWFVESKKSAMGRTVKLLSRCCNEIWDFADEDTDRGRQSRWPRNSRPVCEKFGLWGVEAATGIEALDQARAVHPDLILMDLVLPEMPGYEVTARLKADPSTREIPIIVLTTLSRGSQSVESAIAAGAAETLFKPFTFKALGEAMRRRLSPPNESHSWLVRSAVPDSSESCYFFF
jgi:CheY-like chemotaxis protein